MLEVRKYVVPDGDKMTFDEFISWSGGQEEAALRETMGSIYTKRTASEEGTESKIKIGTSWLPVPDLGNAKVEKVTSYMKEHNLSRLILIIQGKITHQATDMIGMFRHQKIVIETFTETELQYNILKHIDVPKHYICSDKTKAEVLAQYGVDKTKMPKILSTEPVCRFLGATKGQLIRIIRLCETTPKIDHRELREITYRCVV